MAASDARPIPQKNVAYRVTFGILDADGDLVTGATGLDSEISKDGGTFADCTNEATEIATASGMYYLDLTSTEMNADTVAIIVKTTSAGAKTTPLVLYPEELGDVRVNVGQWNGTAVPAEHTAGYPIVTIKDGTGTGEIDTASGRVAITETQIDQIVDEVWDEDATGHQTQGTFGRTIGDPVADTDTIWGLVNTNLDAAVSSRLAPTVAARTLDVSAGGEAGIDWANVGSPTTALNLSGTTIKTATDVETDTADLQTRLGTPSDLGGGASIAANLVDIEAQTDDIGVAGAGLSAVPWNAAWDAEVQSEVADALGVYDPPTAAELASEINDVQADVAAVKADTAAILADTGTDGVVVAAGSKDGYSLSAAGVQAIWDALTSALSTASSIGKLLVDNVNATISSRATPAQVNTEADTALADVGLTTTVTGRIDAAVSTRASQTSVDTIDDLVDTELAAVLAAVDTEVAAIKAKTDNLPAAPAATGDIPTAIQNADALLDRANAIETGWTLRKVLRILFSSQAGKLSGAATTTVTIRDVPDTKARVTATVDADGNRSAVTLDGD